MIRKIAAALLMLSITIASFVYAAQPAIAINEWNSNACNDEKLDDEQKAALGCEMGQTVPSVVEGIINGVIAVVGLVAVVIVVMGGQRFIVSQGDPAKITAARGMIIYGIVGLLVAALAFSIVNFVLAGIFSR